MAGVASATVRGSFDEVSALVVDAIRSCGGSIVTREPLVFKDPNPTMVARRLMFDGTGTFAQPRASEWTVTITVAPPPELAKRYAVYVLVVPLCIVFGVMLLAMAGGSDGSRDAVRMGLTFFVLGLGTFLWDSHKSHGHTSEAAASRIVHAIPEQAVVSRSPLVTLR